jgi:PilZ domain
MDTSATGRPEARRAPRFALEQVVAIRSLDGRFQDASGVSHNVSACGIFFYVDECLPVGATVELVMMMPQESPLSDAIFPLRCLGSIVRVVNDDGRCGVGVSFDRIEVIAEA